MNTGAQNEILDVMKQHRIMTVATVRDDGYPQATTVTYANDGFTLYFVCDRNSQKVNNIKHHREVSLTIDHDEEDWNKIRGISLGGDAEIVERNEKEYQRAFTLMKQKFPQIAEVPDADLAQMAIVRVTPKVISLLDYSKGFGHTELVRV